MEPRRLGRTPLTVSRVGLGTVKLGRNQDVKYPQPFDLPTDAEVESLLEGALAAGVRFFDTAPAYGSSESRLAPFRKAHRDEVVVATKAGESYEHGRSHYDFSADAVRASVLRSADRLGAPLDLVLLHGDGRDEWILTESGSVEALTALRDEGVVRAIGLSAKTTRGIQLAAQSLDVVMAPFSRAEPELGPTLREAHRAGCGVIAIKTLASGHAASAGPDGARAALDYALGQPWIDVVVVGTLNLNHLESAVAIAAEAQA